MPVNVIELNIFSSRIEAVCEEMGAVLKRASFSPNIKDRLDFSCAVFDASGLLCAQAAHIPVHLGSMAYAMKDIVGSQQWQPDDMVVVNDPYLGGTHLPDVTVIAPVFVGQKLQGFVANRAHHANIGATSPGSMPISRTLQEEGVVIAPTKLVSAGVLQEAIMDQLCGASGDPKIRGDFAAQISANRVGVKRLQALIEGLGITQFSECLHALNSYGERLALSELKKIPDGTYRFSDRMDDDGVGSDDIVIAVTLRVAGSDIDIDFSGTAPQVPGNINCPLSVTAAAVYFAFRCLLPDQAPACEGTFRHLNITAPEGSLVNANYPAAVAAGNVETSTRMVDVVLGALAQALPDRIPAAAQGSMNNIAMGAAARAGQPRWDYYETIGGGMGAHSRGNGLSAVQTHMTNTLNTPIESLESHYPLRVRRYQIRRDSGGCGRYRGGDGLVREFEFLSPATLTLLTERRTYQPWGLDGGEGGAQGENLLNGRPISGKTCLQVEEGDVLTIKTPGGGGFGRG